MGEAGVLHLAFCFGLVVPGCDRLREILLGW